MKVWTKVHITENDKEVEMIARSLTNYLYEYGPFKDLCRKYNINEYDKRVVDQYTANRIAGLLLLYLTKDVKRINDIANKYNIDTPLDVINPEIEGYIDK